MKQKTKRRYVTCLECNKRVLCGAYCIENHYTKYHPEIDWRSDKELLRFKFPKERGVKDKGLEKLVEKYVPIKRETKSEAPVYGLTKRQLRNFGKAARDYGIKKEAGTKWVSEQSNIIINGHTHPAKNINFDVEIIEKKPSLWARFKRWLRRN